MKGVKEENKASQRCLHVVANWEDNVVDSFVGIALPPVGRVPLSTGRKGCKVYRPWAVLARSAPLVVLTFPLAAKQWIGVHARLYSTRFLSLSVLSLLCSRLAVFRSLIKRALRFVKSEGQ